MNQTSGQPSAQIIRVLWRQQQELLKKSPDCVKPIINSEDPLDIQADIEGPKGTPYEGGIFRVKLFIPGSFPQTAPKGFFLTKIYHPNVSEKGEICVNTLKRDWNPRQWSLYNLFEVIKCLLIVPFPESSLNEEAGKIFMENYEEYCNIAKIYTNVHAMKKIEHMALNPSELIQDNVKPFQNIIMKNQTNPLVQNPNINSDQNLTMNFRRVNNDKMDIEEEEKRESHNNFSNGLRRAQTINFGAINQFTSKNNLLSNFNNRVEKNNFEKPKLGSLPFMRSNSLKTNQNQNQFFRCNSNILNNDPGKQSTNDEINKWLMRI